MAGVTVALWPGIAVRARGAVGGRLSVARTAGCNSELAMPLSSALPLAAFFAAAVLGFAVLHWLTTRFVPSARDFRRGLLPAVLGAATFSLLLLGFSAAASAVRVEATAARDTYLAAASAALWLTYVLAAVASAVLGAALAHPGTRTRFAKATIVGVALFMLAVLPLSELVTECYANVTLALKPSC